MARLSLSDKVHKKLQKWVGIIGAITTIVGVLTGMFTWVSTQFANAVASQISDFREEVKESNMRQDQAITRLELLNLMENDPTNIVGIEKLARYYFQELNGNQYMTGVFSRWCQEYGGDPSIAIGGR